MAAFNGKDMVVQVGNGASPEVFGNVNGLKTTSFSINRNPVDISNKDSAGWAQKLNTAAIASIALSGNGVFTDAASQETLRAAAFTGNDVSLRFKYGSNDYFQGKFVIGTFELSGGYDDAQVYSFSAESNGTPTFTNGS